MRTGANPFTDPAEVQGPLYATAGRLASRTSALHRARVGGRHAAVVIADLTAESVPSGAPIIADIGCGRGTTTCVLAARLPRASQATKRARAIITVTLAITEEANELLTARTIALIEGVIAAFSFLSFAARRIQFSVGVLSA